MRGEDTGLKPAVGEAIRELARQHGLSAVTLFGSRARGTHRPKSDIDLALSGGDVRGFILDAEEAVPTLLAFDFVDLNGPVQDELRRIIEREGVYLYEEVR